MSDNEILNLQILLRGASTTLYPLTNATVNIDNVKATGFKSHYGGVIYATDFATVSIANFTTLFAIGLIDSSSNSRSTTYADLSSLVSKALVTTLF